MSNMDEKRPFYYNIRLAYQLLFPLLTVRLSIIIFVLTALPLTLLTKFGVTIGLTLWLSILLILTIGAYLHGFSVLSMKKDPPEENHHYLQSLDAKFYGISRKLLFIETELFSEGYSISTHKVIISCVADTFYSIEHSTLLPHAPEEAQPVKIELIDQQYKNIKLKAIELERGKNRLFWQLNFLPCLAKGSTVHYCYKERAPDGSYAMNLEELKRRNMSFESHSMRISYPTEHYKHKIIFPKGFDPLNCDYDVWLGEGKVQHREEVHRIKKYWHVGREKDDRMYMELSVKHPIHGLIYVLKWRPS